METVPCVPGCCSTVPPVQIPGAEGEPGIGTNGTNGINAYTVTLSDFVIPAINSNVTIGVGTSLARVVGEIVFVGDGTNEGHFQVASIPGDNSLELKFLGYNGDSAPGVTVAAGAGLTPSGTQPPLSGALPTSLTDNSTGTASNTIAAGTGVYTLAFYIEAAVIANGDLLTDYVPGHRFKILKFDARCAKPVTTGAKASNLNLEIDSANLTGGVVALAETYALGAAQAGTTVTGNNIGTATQSVSIIAGGTTAFVEGAFWLLISIQNLDSADAVASLAHHVNDLITALTP